MEVVPTSADTPERHQDGASVQEIAAGLALQPSQANELQQLREAFDAEKNEVAYLREQIAVLQGSFCWRMTTPFRTLNGLLLRAQRVLKKAWVYWRRNGTHALVRAARRRLGGGHLVSPGVHALPGSAISSRLFAGQSFDVVFAIGCWEGESKRYRVENVAQGLNRLGYQTHTLSFSEIGQLAELKIRAKVVVIFRAPFDPSTGIEAFLDYARQRRIRVIFDVDDLVFYPDIVDRIDGVRLLPEHERRQYLDGVHQYRKMLLAADFVTVPTEFLRGRVEQLGKDAGVIPNSLNFEQLRIAESLSGRLTAEDDAVRIGYFSGSRTHQADFAQCAEGLMKVLRVHPKVRLRIVGYLELDERWNEFEARIERAGFQPYQTMLRTLAECDINLAPLDVASEFCQAKSELKFFEAGLLGIPTVASPTWPFASAIVNGVNGFLANTPAEWTEAIQGLVISAKLRKTIGAQAHQTSVERFGPASVASIAAKVYGLGPRCDISVSGAQARGRGKLTIAWVIPGLIIGGGGHRNILRAAYFLSRFGYGISLYFTGTEDDPAAIKRKIQKHFYPLNCPVHLFQGSIAGADVVFATHWTTVSAALTARNSAKEVMYFVQDFEPAFAPMGSEYVLAENTYRLGLYHITSGPWCERILRRDFTADADHFLFPVDTETYYPRTRSKSNRNLVFFAKPEMPRRCFELGVMALRQFHQLRPDVEIILFGSRHLADQTFDFKATIREIVPTIEGLAQMYSDADVGLVFSTTNPSLIPYEMMACGLPVVDLERGDNALNYGGRHDIAMLANPLPERMAQTLAELFSNPEELARRRETGLAFVKTFPSEEQMARRIERLILARMAQSGGANDLNHSGDANAVPPIVERNDA